MENKRNATGSSASATENLPDAATPSYEIPAYKLFDSTSIALATFLGSPVAGTGLIALNYRRLGKDRSAATAFVIGIAATGLALGFGSFIPSYATSAVAVGLFVATWNASKSLQAATIGSHVQHGGRLGSRWVASGIGLCVLPLIVCSATAVLVAKGTTSKIIIGNRDEVYYSGSATKRNAMQLGEALKNIGYFRDAGVVVLLSKKPPGASVTFVVRDGAWNQPRMVSAFEEIGREVAPAVGGFPIKIRLANSSRDTMKEMVVGRAVIGTKDEIFYYGASTEQEAKALGQSLASAGFLQDRGVSVFLNKQDGSTTLSFVVSEGSWDVPQNLAIFVALARQAAPAIGGLPLKLRLENPRLEVKKELTVS
jgi:hypothetical protein